MEILKSKINEFPNYFLINTSRNKNDSNIINRINTEKKEKIDNKILKIKSFYLPSKNIETQTFLENKNINTNIIKNNSHKKIKINIKPYVNMENKTLKKFIYSYRNNNKSKLNNTKIKLDKLYYTYFPKNYHFINKNKNYYIKEENDKNDIKKNILEIKLNKKINNNNINNINNKKIKINNSVHKIFLHNYKYIDTNKDYNYNYNKQFNNPILIKDLEISKLIKKIKKKNKLIYNNKNYFTPNKNKNINKTHYNKIFLTPDIFKHKKTFEDLFYSQFINFKLLINKRNNNNKYKPFINNDNKQKFQKYKLLINIKPDN